MITTSGALSVAFGAVFFVCFFIDEPRRPRWSQFTTRESRSHQCEPGRNSCGTASGSDRMLTFNVARSILTARLVVKCSVQHPVATTTPPAGCPRGDPCPFAVLHPVPTRLRSCWLWLDQSKISVFSFIEHADAIRVGVAKDDELIRLRGEAQRRFFGGHWFN